MNPVLNLYGKIFIFTGLPYAIIMTVFDLLSGDEFVLWKFLFLMCFFGIAMSLLLVSFHIQGIKKIGVDKITEKNIGTHHEKRISSNLDLNEVMNVLGEKTLLNSINIRKMDNGILFNTAKNWRTWGENLKIELVTQQDSDYVYQVSSSPRVKTTLVDYGRNLQNVNRIVQAIQK